MGGPLYDPQAYEGGGRGPVSPGVAKAGYLTTAITALEKGYQEKRQRQGQMLKTRADIADQNLAKIRSDMDKYKQDPDIINQLKQKEVQAMSDQEKIKKEFEKHFGADKTVFGALWDKITKAKTQPDGSSMMRDPGISSGGKKGTQPAPTPTANKGAPPSTGYVQKPGLLEAQANFDATKAITEGKTEKEIDEEKRLSVDYALQQAKDKAVKQVELKAAQQQYIDVIRKQRNQDISVDEAIKKVTDITFNFFPPDSSDPDGAKKLNNYIANQTIAIVNGALQMPFYANQPEEVKRLHGIKADQENILAGRTQVQQKLPSKDQEIWDGLYPGVDFNQATPEQLAGFKKAKDDAATQAKSKFDLNQQIGHARLNQIKASVSHINRLGGGGKPETTRSFGDRASRILTSVYSQVTSGTTEAGLDTPQQKAATEKAIAQSIIDQNPDIAKKMKHGEDPVTFINRMRMSPPEAITAVPPPEPTAGGATPSAAVPVGSSNFSDAFEQVAPIPPTTLH